MIRYNTWFSILIFVFAIPSFHLTEQQDDGWKFKKHKSGIKIYTRESNGTNIKELKFTTKINSTLNQAVSQLIDVPTYSDWVYSCDHAATLKEISNLESYCYYKVDFPWPMADRDLVVYSEIKQDPITKVVISNTKCDADYLPEEDGYIRIKDHFNQWIFTPVSPNEIEITYLLKSDPGGSIPAWAVNLAIDQGPVRSMKAFRKRLNDVKYKNGKIEGIEDF